jgi:transposase-like protein
MSKTTKESKNLQTYLLVKAKKLKFIEEAGGCCKLCGETRPWVLTFHHLDEDKKEYKMVHLINCRLSKLQTEVDKCIVVCQNCHRKIHADLDPRESHRIKNKECMLDYKNIYACEKCGYKENNKCLDFHHINAEEKEMTLSPFTNAKRYKSKDDIEWAIKMELDKCCVLCANCHFDLHFDKEKYNRYYPDIMRIKENHKEQRPALPVAEIIEHHRNGKGVSEIARIYGVNKSTIATITRKNNLGESLTEKMKKSEENRQKVKQLREENKSIKEIATILNMSKRTVAWYLRNKKNKSTQV